MKSTNYIKAIFILILSVAAVSCNKDLDEGEDFAPLVPAQQDEDAMDWLSVSTDATDVTLAKIKTAAETSTPKIFDPSNDMATVVNVASDAYKAELATIKDAQSQLTRDQKKSIEYWSGGGVLRWNQILRGLVARYSLPPAPRDDGSYVFPDAENPFADPQFPFANPPYAARAYSYVSTAQYEALKAAWYYMHTYNRPSPYKTDSGIKLLMPETNLPAYPSHDAVLSGVTAEMLKLLFPAALEEITLKAAEQRNAALWSGKASTSDIAKGLALGKSVAALFIARARGDGTGNAIGTKTQWAALTDSAKLHLTKMGRDVTNEIFWKSLDIPARPPMLPFFGKVKGWAMTPANFASKRPGPPPSTSSEGMKKDLAEVKSVSEKLTREQLALVHKWADGAGTYTPPGHWNDIAADYIYNANFSEVRTARAFALLNMTMHNAAVGCWDVKYYWFSPRPSQLDPSIKTATGLPNFPSYTSGHSTFSAAAAEVLSYLFPAKASEFNAMVEEASISRLYGSIHYRTDIDAGKLHGKSLAEYTISFAQSDGADNN
jgi:hypothetical protein